MAEVEAFIWHDEHGEIVAVGHVPSSCKRRVEPRAGAGRGVIKQRIEETHLRTLHLTHHVEIAQGTLRARDTAS